MAKEMLDIEEVCANCKHYCQHYSLGSKLSSPYWVNCGHCIFPRLKNRKPDCKVCEHFELRV